MMLSKKEGVLIEKEAKQKNNLVCAIDQVIADIPIYY